MPDLKIFRTLAVLIAVASPAAFGASFEPTWGRDGMVVTSVSPAAPVGVGKEASNRPSARMRLAAAFHTVFAICP